MAAGMLLALLLNENFKKSLESPYYSRPSYTRAERKAIKARQKAEKTKEAFQKGNGELVTDIFKQYVVNSELYQAEEKGVLEASFEGATLKASWNHTPQFKYYNRINMDVTLSRGENRDEGACFFGSTTEDIHFGHAHASGMIGDEEWSSDLIEERIAFKLLQFSQALRTGEASFQKPAALIP